MNSIASALGIVLRGLGLGTLTGGAYGVATLSVATLLASAGSGSGTGSLDEFVSALGLAFAIGCVAGAADAVPVVIGLVLLRTLLTTPARARWVSAATATIAPVLTLAAGMPWSFVIGVAVACAVGAAVWARIVVGLTEASAEDRAARR